jgi:hypothetical protein
MNDGIHHLLKQLGTFGAFKHLGMVGTLKHIGAFKH